jgi:hypothetical protein
MTKDVYENGEDGIWSWIGDHEDDHLTKHDYKPAFYILIILILILQFQFIIFVW